LQAAFCAFCKLESFRNSQPFNPKNIPVFGFGHDELMPERTCNLLIYKEILQFDPNWHSDGLEAVAFPPMP
jgi:hypothetical protein